MFAFFFYLYNKNDETYKPYKIIVNYCTKVYRSKNIKLFQEDPT